MDEEKNNPIQPEVQAEPMRPVLIASRRTLDEYSLYLERLMVGFADASISAVLICPADYDVGPILSPSVEVIYHPASRLPFTGEQNRKILFEKIGKFKPNVVHCLCMLELSLARKISSQFNLPCVLSVNSLEFTGAKPDILSKTAANIIVPSETIAVNMEHFSPQLAGRIRRINIGSFVQSTTACFKKANVMPSLFSCFPASDGAGLGGMLDAIRHLSVDGYEFVTVLMGSGKMERQVRRQLAQLGLSQSVSIVPMIQPYRAVLNAADIFIQPQPNNSFNLMLLEAMSVGCAVAACRGGVDDLIINGQTALVFNVNDSQSIYTCLRQLLDSRETARKIARQGQEYVRANHTVSKMVSDTLETYQLALQESVKK